MKSLKIGINRLDVDAKTEQQLREAQADALNRGNEIISCVSDRFLARARDLAVEANDPDIHTRVINLLRLLSPCPLYSVHTERWGIGDFPLFRKFSDEEFELLIRIVSVFSVAVVRRCDYDFLTSQHSNFCLPTRPFSGGLTQSCL